MKMPLRLTKRSVLIASAIVIIVASGTSYALYQRTKDKPTEVPAPVINMNPATEEEKQQAEDNKDRIVKELSDAEQNQPPTGTKKQVNVVISNASNNNVSAYVTGVFEEGGTCTATFTQGDILVTRTSEGFANASYTQCAPIKPDLPTGGKWSVTVSYSSTSAEGTSTAQTF